MNFRNLVMWAIIVFLTIGLYNMFKHPQNIQQTNNISFSEFLAPGLIAMQVIQQAFSHSSSTFMIGKIQGNIVDLLYAPLSAFEVSISIILAAVTRSMVIGTVSTLVFFLIVDLKIFLLLIMIKK